MRTIDYIDVLNASARASGIAPDMASGDEFESFRGFHNDRLKRNWERRPWHDIKRTEKRYYRDLYAAQVYAAEVYYPGPQKYYLALRAVLSTEAPATYNATTRTWTTNLAYWAESGVEYSADEYSATRAYVRGDQVFYSITGLFYQLFAAASTGNAPSSAANWGVLTEFDRYVAYEQTGKTAFEHAFSAWDRDPDGDGRARMFSAFHSNLGLQVLDDEPFCWMVYRIRRPILKGDVFDATATYAVGDQVYFSSTTTRGNFYDCVAVTTAGQSPDTNAAKWTVVPLPAQFQTYLIHGAAADYLAADEEPMRRDREESTATEDLTNQTLLHDAQLAHLNRTQVGTR